MLFIFLTSLSNISLTEVHLRSFNWLGNEIDFEIQIFLKLNRNQNLFRMYGWEIRIVINRVGNWVEVIMRFIWRISSHAWSLRWWAGAGANGQKASLGWPNPSSHARAPSCRSPNCLAQWPIDSPRLASAFQLLLRAVPKHSLWLTDHSFVCNWKENSEKSQIVPSGWTETTLGSCYNPLQHVGIRHQFRLSHLSHLSSPWAISITIGYRTQLTLIVQLFSFKNNYYTHRHEIRYIYNFRQFFVLVP